MRRRRYIIYREISVCNADYAERMTGGRSEARFNLGTWWCTLFGVLSGHDWKYMLKEAHVHASKLPERKSRNIARCSMRVRAVNKHGHLGQLKSLFSMKVSFIYERMDNLHIGNSPGASLFNSLPMSIKALSPIDCFQAISAFYS